MAVDDEDDTYTLEELEDAVEHAANKERDAERTDSIGALRAVAEILARRNDMQGAGTLLAAADVLETGAHRQRTPPTTIEGAMIQ